ncbi:spondin domain-containing protein [Haladaptatus sp. NG-SE-30]
MIRLSERHSHRHADSDHCRRNADRDRHRTRHTRRDLLRTTALGGTAALTGLAGFGAVSAQDGGDQETEFTVRIRNVSTDDTLQPPEGETQPIPLSPGAYAVYRGGNPIFTPGNQGGAQGLEMLAEDGNPTQLERTLDDRQGVSSDVFDRPEGSDQPGPIGPGQEYRFDFDARPGERLSFATMFIPSNDLFYAPIGAGIPLFRNGNPIGGNVTSQVLLWDAGTEQNEQPGTGPNQAPRQSGPNTGMDENASVQPIRGVGDGFQYPAVVDVIRVTVRSRRA